MRICLQILKGDCRELVKTLPDQSIQCVVTSPSYWGLRSYLPKDHPNKHLEIGHEKTPQLYVETMVALFREIRRALKDDGTLWLNLGDSYARNGGKQDGGNRELMHMGGVQSRMLKIPADSGLKEKDLIGIPWRVALALQADGWWLRSDIIWAKPNCMPESVTDRPTRSHEYIFLLTKSKKYYYDHEAIKEPCVQDDTIEARDLRASESLKSMPTAERNGIRPPSWRDSDFHDGKNAEVHPNVGKQRSYEGHHKAHLNDNWDNRPVEALHRNKRDVWFIPPAQFREAHFAVFPPDLIKPCILAGSKIGDTILDPFGGSGTTARVALEYGRKAIVCELNEAYHPMIEGRTNVTPGFI